MRIQVPVFDSIFYRSATFVLTKNYYYWFRCVVVFRYLANEFDVNERRTNYVWGLIYDRKCRNAHTYTERGPGVGMWKIDHCATTNFYLVIWYYIHCLRVRITTLLYVYKKRLIEFGVTACHNRIRIWKKETYDFWLSVCLLDTSLAACTNSFILLIKYLMS